MSEKPQQRREDAPDGDVIEQVSSKALNNPGEPPQEQALSNEESPSSEKKPEEEASGHKKNKRSSTYIYLLILFGAAFFMLLLAYFIQQRNSETAISDLRDTMNLSREELMEEIEGLKQEKEELEEALEKTENSLTVEQNNRESAESLADAMSYTVNKYSAERELANALGWLERFCAEGDWLMAAVVVENSESLFNEYDINYSQRPAGLEPNPLQTARYLQLQQEAYDKSGCMVCVIQEGAGSDGETAVRTEHRYIADENITYDPETVACARSLWLIISHYSNDCEPLAELVESAYANGDWERLNGGAFQPSTVEVLERITQDLVDQGLLTENEDGTFTSRAA